MYEAMCRLISAHPAWEKGIMCGVSGGADSVALLDALVRLGAERGFPVYAAHYNHMIRGSEADRDEQFVRDLAASLNVPLAVGRGDAPALAAKEGIPLEQAARRLRYDFFGEALRSFSCDTAAVAHHMDDQAETVLMHILRGSGVHGLRGMEYENKTDYGFTVVRPLLNVRRADIEAYIAERGLSYVTDSTNLALDARRNRVRLELMPYLEREFNQNIAEALSSLSRLAAEDDDHIISEAESALVPVGDGWDRAAIAALPAPLRARALFILLRRWGAPVDIERKHIDALTALLTAPSGRSLDLPGVTVRVSGGRITASPMPASEPWETPFSADGCVVPTGEIVCRPWNGEAFDMSRQVIDLDKLPRDAVIRNRRQGDRLHPAGAEGSKKLKEFFIDKKIPLEARGKLPLLASGGRILAVLGVCVCAEIAVDETTQRGLIIEYRGCSREMFGVE